MIGQFRAFILRGNLVELAVAFVIAGAFALVVNAFVGLILSIASLVFGGPPNFDSVAPGGVLIGPVITTTISFLVIAAVVYFFVVTPYQRLQERRALGQEQEAEPPSDEVTLLTEIRDLLSSGNGRDTT